VEQAATDIKPRALRRHAFICLQVMKYKHLPFMMSDAILIDLTDQGMKLKFARNVKMENGSHLWLRVPVSSDIDNKKFILMRGTVRWYDAANFALGITINPSEEEHRQALRRLIREFIEIGRLAS
jgi:hypothetical protein